MGEDANIFDARGGGGGLLPPKETYRMLKAGGADIMLSGGRTKFIALKARVPWLDINQERPHAYAGRL